ncbi:MAG TPA: alpha/beta fold hydrolase, partial [Acidobacteriota bacterium]
EAWRTGLSNNTSEERLIRVPLDPRHRRRGEFDLYYFIEKPLGNFEGMKTVLFCAGGPGKVVEPGMTDENNNLVTFLRDSNTAYQVVHFHVRGAGLSQLAPDNRYDHFLQSKFAVADIERIRLHVLKDQPWDGVIGYSHGTILAHRYAHKYAKHVRKLILIGPISMHGFKSPKPKEAYKRYSESVAQIREEVLAKITKRYPEFHDPDLLFKNYCDPKYIEGKAKPSLIKIFQLIEQNYGSEQFIADHYISLLKTRSFRKLGLADQRQRFFQQLREFRNLGWQAIESRGGTDQQEDMVKETLLGLSDRKERDQLIRKIGQPEPDTVVNAEPNDASRVFYAMSTFDGANRRYWHEWFNGGSRDVRKSLIRSGGSAGANPYVNTVGTPASVKPRIWDPADYAHDVTTLIMCGSAEPVSADGQGQYYAQKALRGKRSFIEFKGVGHLFQLPQVDIKAPYLIASIRVNPGTFKARETREVTALFPARVNITDSGDSDHVKGLGRQNDNLDFQKAIIQKEQVYVSVFNSSKSGQPSKSITVRIDHPFYEGQAKIENVSIPPRTTSWVHGPLTISKKQKIQICPPMNLQKRLTLVNYEVEPPNKVYLTLRNKTDRSITIGSVNFLCLPLTSSSPYTGPSQGNNLPVRNCLIFAFLEMEFEDFRNKKSVFIDQIAKKGYVSEAWHRWGNNVAPICNRTKLNKA